MSFDCRDELFVIRRIYFVETVAGYNAAFRFIDPDIESELRYSMIWYILFYGSHFLFFTISLNFRSLIEVVNP